MSSSNSTSSRHPTWGQTFHERASTASHPLTSYLLRLIDLKASNLCLSADVTSARELLTVADKCGPSIVVLKTHQDLVSGWDHNPQNGTGSKLASLARKHGFLIFEDRKFGDIGNTVQLQYTGGTARIIEWAHIVNVNMVPGKAVVTALAEAAARWRRRINYEVRTSVSVGTPVSDTFDNGDLEPGLAGNGSNGGGSRGGGVAGGMPPPTSGGVGLGTTNVFGSTLELPGGYGAASTYFRDAEGRKGSIVSITTVTQSFEPVDSPRLLSKSMADGDEVVFPGIEEAPFDRGLLILAQMSSAGNFMTPEYTAACVEAAREHKGFVMGFVAQENLNSQPGDNFITMTPGCQLPPEGEENGNGVAAGEEEAAAVAGDGKGQRYRTPAKLVTICGADIVIVGRGILQAGDWESEAERYRRRAWKAYLARLS